MCNVKFEISENKFGALAICFSEFPGYKVLAVLKKKKFRYYGVNKTWSTFDYENVEKLSAYIQGLLNKCCVDKAEEAAESVESVKTPVAEEVKEEKSYKRYEVKGYERFASAIQDTINEINSSADYEVVKGKKVVDKIKKSSMIKMIFARDNGYQVILEEAWNKLPKSTKSAIEKNYNLVMTCY